MSKRNKLRYWQSQRYHLKQLYAYADSLDINMFDYHMEIYRTQKYLFRLLSKQEKQEIFLRETQNN